MLFPELNKVNKRRLECLLFVAYEPLSEKRLGELCDLKPTDVRELLLELQQEYAGGGFELKEIAGGWQFLTHPDFAELVEKLYRPKARAFQCCYGNLGYHRLPPTYHKTRNRKRAAGWGRRGDEHFIRTASYQRSRPPRRAGKTYSLRHHQRIHGVFWLAAVK